MNKSILSFYKKENIKRKYGIYSTGLDRFLLIDDLDVWITLETANLLSSKIPNIVYMMPYEAEEIDNINCIEYGIKDKSTQKMGNTLLMFTTQTPVLRTLSGSGVITKFDEYPSLIDNDMLFTLKDYIDYVHKISFAVKFTETITKYEETDQFSKIYIDNETSNMFDHTVERSGLKDSIYYSIRKALYLSNSIQEAEIEIERIWLNHSSDISFIRDIFYKIIEKEQPAEFKDIKPSWLYSNYSG